MQRFLAQHSDKIVGVLHGLICALPCVEPGVYLTTVGKKG